MFVIVKISIPIVKTAVLKNWLNFGEKVATKVPFAWAGGEGGRMGSKSGWQHPLSMAGTTNQNCGRNFFLRRLLILLTDSKFKNILTLTANNSPLKTPTPKNYHALGQNCIHDLRPPHTLNTKMRKIHFPILVETISLPTKVASVYDQTIFGQQYFLNLQQTKSLWDIISRTVLHLFLISLR